MMYFHFRYLIIILPDLVFQKLHVFVEGRVRSGQDAYRFHSCPPLRLAVYVNILKTAQAKVVVFPEISVKKIKKDGVHW